MPDKKREDGTLDIRIRNIQDNIKYIPGVVLRADVTVCLNELMELRRRINELRDTKTKDE